MPSSAKQCNDHRRRPAEGLLGTDRPRSNSGISIISFKSCIQVYGIVCSIEEVLGAFSVNLNPITFSRLSV